jgi:hypothetical protein
MQQPIVHWTIPGLTTNESQEGNPKMILFIFAAK